MKENLCKPEQSSGRPVMKIVFISNFLNHHQTPVADELYRRLGDDYRFISTTETPESFLKSGYPDCRAFPYNILAYESEEKRAEAQRFVDEADAVIIGSAPYSWVEKCVEAGKQTFIYSERWFKRVPRNYFSPGLWKSLFKYHFRWSRKPNVSVLCASAFLPKDLDLFGLYKGRRYKWGYFTECPKLDIEPLVAKRDRECIDIFWCARFIDWKRWDLPILLAGHLKRAGYKFRLRMAGMGDDSGKAKHLIGSQEIEDCVDLIGNLPNAEILKKMEESSIFLFTSNRQEGWGAVLNEAMSRGCACVVGDEIGSAPYLIKDGENGFLFKSCNLEDLTEKVRLLLDDAALRKRVSVAAYETMQGEWGPRGAVSRIISLLNKKLFENGICGLLKK
ncbi:MAG: glycosyltransferase [Opitutales bacterium]|nr:glycosyltransferase [Opitutales bacterium]